jgi:hypothetical protein
MHATTSAPVRPVASGRPSAIRRLIKWRNTPERIRGLTAVIIVVAIAFGTIIAAIFASVGAGVHLIGGQAAPGSSRQHRPVLPPQRHGRPGRQHLADRRPP